jgi:hypothetical protein
MPLEVGLWRVDGGTPVRLTAKGVPLEQQLESMIEADPGILGTPLLLIGRQVPTDFGKFIDLLAVDDEGNLHVLELKRDKTPREVVAQALDYGSWVRDLSHDDVLDIFARYRDDVAFEAEWTATFGGDPPEKLNDGHRLTIVAGDVDPATERIIEYLSAFDVPLNVVFFRYFDDGDRAERGQRPGHQPADAVHVEPQPGAPAGRDLETAQLVGAQPGPALGQVGRPAHGVTGHRPVTRRAVDGLGDRVHGRVHSSPLLGVPARIVPRQGRG